MITLLTYLTRPTFIEISHLTNAGYAELRKFLAGPNYTLAAIIDIVLIGIGILAWSMLTKPKSSSKEES